MHETLGKRNHFGAGMNGVVHTRRAETSSGYSSRESLQDMVPAQSPLPKGSSQHSESNCSCEKSNSSRSTQRYNSVIHLDLDETMKESPSKYSHCSPNSACCLQTHSLARANKQLILQKHLLEEQNSCLSEELQVCRRFYQGILADLTSKLSVAENRIKYLKEMVSTQEEALATKQYTGKHEVVETSLPASSPIATVVHSKSMSTFSDISTNYKPVLGARRQQKSSVKTVLPSTMTYNNEKSDITSRLTVSSASSAVSENNLRRRSPFHTKNYAKMKMQLLEQNQNLKTDIQLLKVQKDMPRSSSAYSSLETSAKPKGLPASTTTDKRRSPLNDKDDEKLRVHRVFVTSKNST